MRELKIALGNSRQAKIWSNKTMTFEDICERLKVPIRTSETTEEYPKLPKPQRDEIKDKGGFVGGHLRDNRRKITNVECRSMWTPDLDNATSEFVAILKEHISFKSAVYSTHSHAPEAPRLRFVAPFKRDVSADEYVAISRYLAADIGIDMFDECSFVPHQLMYWPTCPTNGEYLCEFFDGELLDPDAILAAHPNWKDCSLLPTTSRESKVNKPSQKKQEDPLGKPGVVGAFCRAYSITAAIGTFLTDVYEPSVIEGRYDYIQGVSSAGVVIYDDKFAYSHHATDPACGRLLNAFDLVRIHKFGDDDEKKSFAAMMDFAVSLDAVKLQIAEEKKIDASSEFAEGSDWRSQLRYMPRSSILENSVWNEMLILNNDPDFANFAFNEMANRIQITGNMPWERPRDNPFWRDADTAQLKAIIDVRYVMFSTRNHDVAFTKVADDRHFHPVRDYLDALPEWDGTVRCDTLFIQYLQADDTPYTRAISRKTLTAAVARIYYPGTKFDSVPVLDGAQGIGKSSIWKELAGDEYFSDALSLTDMDDKAGAEKLQGFWIIEIGELAGMKKADIEKVKSFMSTADDKYRPSYGKVVESHPRQCLIVATVNGEQGYLRDITGNRRFWIIKCHQQEKSKLWKITPEERDQIWAEAKYYYENGEKLYLEGELLSAAENEQKAAMEADDREGLVEEYLNLLLPDNWASMKTYERRNYFTDHGDDPTLPEGTHQRTYTTNAEIWAECFGKNVSEMRPSDSYAIAAIMTRIDGWKRSDERKQVPIYGRQRLYLRTE